MMKYLLALPDMADRRGSIRNGKEDGCSPIRSIDVQAVKNCVMSIDSHCVAVSSVSLGCPFSILRCSWNSAMGEGRKVLAVVLWDFWSSVVRIQRTRRWSS